MHATTHTNSRTQERAHRRPRSQDIQAGCVRKRTHIRRTTFNADKFMDKYVWQSMNKLEAALTDLAHCFPQRRPLPESSGLHCSLRPCCRRRLQQHCKGCTKRLPQVPPQTHKWILTRRLGGVGGSAKHLKGICSFAVLLLGLLT